MQKLNLKQDTTSRGFPLVEFNDFYDNKCNIQLSSLATDDAIWIGIDDAHPQIIGRKVRDGLTGWVDYPIPDDVLLHTRMHLTRDMVAQLIPILQRFVDSGEVSL